MALSMIYFSPVLAGIAAVSGIVEIMRPRWVTKLEWRAQYPSGVLYMRGAADVLAAVLMTFPQFAFFGSALLLATSMTVLTALLIDLEFQLSLVPFAVALGASVNGFYSVN